MTENNRSCNNCIQNPSCELKDSLLKEKKFITECCCNDWIAEKLDTKDSVKIPSKNGEIFPCYGCGMFSCNSCLVSDSQTEGLACRDYIRLMGVESFLSLLSEKVEKLLHSDSKIDIYEEWESPNKHSRQLSIQNNDKIFFLMIIFSKQPIDYKIV